MVSLSAFGPREAVTHLLDRGLLEPAAVVRGGLRVVDLSRRNCNLGVHSELGPSYLLKQATDAERATTLAHEAAVYAFLSVERGPLPRMPGFRAYDPERALLILELLTDTRDLREHQARLGRFPVGAATGIGAALGRLHDPRVAESARRTPGVALDGPEPWILSLHHPGTRLLHTASAANVELVKIAQDVQELGAELDCLRGEWRRDALCHLDVRWENWLVPRGAGHRPALVDWELADLGDPAWDLGSAFADYLALWVLSVPISSEQEPARHLALARHPLETMQPAIRALWRAYRKVRGKAADGELLTRAVRSSAARLLQTAYEQDQGASRPSGGALFMMQVAENILLRTEQAAVHLLGLPLTSEEVA